MARTVDNPFRESARVLGHFVKAQFLIAGADIVLYSVGYAVAHLPWWPLVAVLSGLCSVIPQFGGLLALAIAGFAGLFGELDFTHWMIVLVTWIAVQMIEGFVLTPKILGDRLGLNPFVVFFVVAVSGLFLGPLGLFLAVPVLAVANIFWRYSRQRTG